MSRFSASRSRGAAPEERYTHVDAGTEGAREERADSSWTSQRICPTAPRSRWS